MIGYIIERVAISGTASGAREARMSVVEPVQRKEPA
jgi:hypothetical protein